MEKLTLSDEYMEKANANAAKIHMYVKRSTRKNKKLDVYYEDETDKVASIGDIRYTDFLMTNDKEQRKRWIARHRRHLEIGGSPAYFAFKIMWS